MIGWIIIYSLGYVVGGLLQHVDNQKNNVATALLVNGYTDFHKLLCQVGMFDVLFDKEPLLIFIPSKNVFKKSFQRMTLKQKKDAVESLMFKNFLNTSSFKDGQKIENLKKKSFFINKHVNHFTLTHYFWLQGVEVSNLNIRTQKSIFYGINQIPVSPSFSFMTYLKDSGRHRTMLALFEKYNVYFTFYYGATFFLPLDDSFKSIPTKYKESIFTDDIKSRNFIRSHIINRPMCRQRLFLDSGWSTFTNDIGQPLTLYQDLFNKDSSYVNGMIVLSTNALTDGWAYGIDGILLPDINDNLLESLPHLQCHTFLQYLIKTGHMKQLQSAITSHTLFAPTDQAFERLDKEFKKTLDSDQNYLTVFIKYHFLVGRYITEQFVGINAVETTAESNQTFLKVHLETYLEASSVQNVIISKRDVLATNGIIHVINNVLIPPNQSVFEILKNTKAFQLFAHEIIKNKVIVDLLSQSNESFTIFAPTKRAIKIFEMSFRKENKSSIFSTELLSRHVGRKAVFTNLMFLNEELIIKTYEQKSGNSTFLRLRNTKVNQPIIIDYQSTLLTQNIVATNGVIHALDKVLTNEIIESAYLSAYRTQMLRVRIKKLQRNKRIPSVEYYPI